MNAKSININDYVMYSDMDDDGLYKEGTGMLWCCSSKKLKNIYHLVYDPATLIKAQYKAQKNKGDRNYIRDFNRNIIDRLQELWEMLYYQTYKSGEYEIKKIFEPKERNIMIAPFFPDRIVHHCIIDVLGRHWDSIFITNTYACIKNRGIHKCMDDIHKALTNDRKGTEYCLKLDVHKFYDNVNHSVLKSILRKTISDKQMLWLLDTIVDSNNSDVGLPIGNYTSQYFANIYLSYFDHFAKEELRIKYYFRYMDDIVVLSGDKNELHKILDAFALYLATELKLEIKSNWQIFPVDARSIDYVGYKQNHYGILLRKSILQRFYKKWNKLKDLHRIKSIDDFKHLFPSEYGWLLRCSEEHREFILKKCISYETKFNYGSA